MIEIPTCPWSCDPQVGQVGISIISSAGLSVSSAEIACCSSMEDSWRIWLAATNRGDTLMDCCGSCS